MDSKKEMVKQIKLLVVILLIVIVIAIVIGVKGNKKIDNNTTIQENTIDMSNVVIDGLTKEGLESAKNFMDNDKYLLYKDTFDKIENGELTYEEGMSLNIQDNKTSEEMKEDSENKIDEALQSGAWHYDVTEDGTVTNTIVFDNIDFHNEAGEE